MRIIDSFGPYAICPAWIISADISDRALRTYLALSSYANWDGACRPSQASVAERMRCTVRTFQRGLQELVEAGLVVIVSQGRGRGNHGLYRLVRHVGDKGGPIENPTLFDPPVKGDSSCHPLPEKYDRSDQENTTTGVAPIEHTNKNIESSKELSGEADVASPFKACVMAFVDGYAAHGVSYKFTGRDGAALKRLLKEHSPEEISSRIKLMLDDPWFREKRLGMQTLEGSWNRFAVDESAKAWVQVLAWIRNSSQYSAEACPWDERTKACVRAIGGSFKLRQASRDDLEILRGKFRRVFETTQVEA